jgi:hypothetical protein
MENPFNKDREGVQNRLHNLFEEFKDLDDSEKLLRIYSEVLQVNHSDAIELDQINEFQETQEIPEDISPYELPVYQTLSLKELSYVLFQTNVIDHLISFGLTKEESALLLSMITGISHNSIRQHLSKDWSKLTTENKEYSIKNIHRELWIKARGHEKTTSLINKIDPVASEYLPSKGVTDDSSPKNTDL